MTTDMKENVMSQAPAGDCGDPFHDEFVTTEVEEGGHVTPGPQQVTMPWIGQPLTPAVLFSRPPI